MYPDGISEDSASPARADEALTRIRTQYLDGEPAAILGKLLTAAKILLIALWIVLLAWLVFYDHPTQRRLGSAWSLRPSRVAQESAPEPTGREPVSALVVR